MEPRTIQRPALCPSCGVPGTYRYTIEGPVDRDGERYVRITYSFTCEVCGYRDAGELYVPLEGLHRMRYLLIPEVMAYLERVRLAAQIIDLQRDAAKATG